MIRITPPIKSGDSGPAVGNLQEGLLLLLENGLAQSGEERTHLVDLLKAEQRSLAFSTGTANVITLLQQRNKLEVTGSVDVITAEFINSLLEQLGAFGPSVNGAGFVVDGRVFSKRAGVGGLRVVIIDRNVGENTNVSVAQTITRPDGRYRAIFAIPEASRHGKELPDLQARVFAGDVFLGESEVRYNATHRETLNIFLTAKATATLPSELETLTSSLSKHFDGNLRDLKESDEQQDVTYLANKTGWDARAVALAALADQFSARTTGGSGRSQVESPFFYALFRAGVPANEAGISQINARTAIEIWEKAIAQGVIPSDLETQIDDAARNFQQVAIEHSLDQPALRGLSSLSEMLSISLGNDRTQHTRFAEIYAEHGNDTATLWQEIRTSFGEATEKRLKLDGQLAYLTLNNAPLMTRLRTIDGQTELTDAATLAAKGLYRADKWIDLIGNEIPAAITGKTDDERRNRYAEALAAQIRLSYPTMVVAHMVQEGATPVPAERVQQVHSFLVEHQGKFEISMEPVQRYIARNQLQLPKEVADQITRIQRVYQITTSDDSMNALLSAGMDSALKVSRLDEKEFVNRFHNELGGEAHAHLIHAKAREIDNVVRNLAYSYLVARTSPQVGVHSPAKYSNTVPAPVVKAQEQVLAKQVKNITESLNNQAAESPDNAADIIPYATLEALFGEMDFCACEHCKSVLSPAAYLVDLLQFLDRNGQGDAKNPLNILLSRRPDVEHLPLTCENTNTPLPYIDLVNETLEYYVTHNLSLNAYQGHTTDNTIATDELLASPQFVEDKAYETLAGKTQPAPLLPPTPPLPFHQPLEALRRYFDKFEAPLPEVMEALRTSDGIERPSAADPANPVEYGWRDILMEELRISRAEYTRLTNSSLTLNSLYGFPPQTSNAGVMAGLSNVKKFARRMQISYVDVVGILKTRFVNPSSTLVPRLEELGVPFATLKAFKDGTMSQAELAEFNELISGVDASHFGGDVKAWITNATNFTRIMSLITLTAPSDEEDLCNFDNVEFRYANPVPTNTLRPFEFHRFIRFVRLWKKLGWTIEQTDKAITALYPENQNPNSPDDAINLQRLDQGFLIMLPRLGVIRRLITILKLKPKKDLFALLACFASIDTHGSESLYRQMFLSPAPSETPNPFADDGFGNFLTADEPLSNHFEAIRAAFLLTDDELKHITTSLNFNDQTLLKIDTVSAIFRRGWLARKLKLSVRELLLLIESTGIDPFASPDPPQPPILRFIDLVNRLRVSLKPAQALYLIWNHDISGKSVPKRDEILGFVRTLRAAFAAIESEFSVTDDPSGQIARARMALVYGNETTNFFFGLLDGTSVTEVQYDHPQDKLGQQFIDAAAGHIAYDDFRKRLSFSGVMSESTRDALKVGATPAFETAVDNLFNENQKLINPFFARFPELRPLHDAFVFFGDLKNTVAYTHPEEDLEQTILDEAPGRITYHHANSLLSFKGVLAAVTRDALKAVAGVPPDFQTAVDSLFAANQAAIQAFFANHQQLISQQEAYLSANDSLEQRRSLLLQSFLPELKQRRKRQQALAVISAAAKTDITVAIALLDDITVLNSAATPPDEPALADLTVMETAGLSANMYSGTAVGVQPDQTSDAEANLAYPPTGSTALPFNPASVVWTGYLEAPENGFYNFAIDSGAEGEPGATNAIFTLNDEDKPLTKDGQVWSNTTPIELRAGTLYSITLQAENITAGLKVRWQTKGRGWEVIPAAYLYSDTLVSHLRTTYLRFLKGASLAAVLKLKAPEIAYFAAAETYHIDGHGWLNSLPVAGNAGAATAIALLKPLEALLDFAALKAKLSPNDERLLTVLKDPLTTIESTNAVTDESSLLLALTRWEGNSLDALLLRFGKSLQAQPDKADRTALQDLSVFLRINRVYTFVKKIGVSAAALIAATTNEPKALAVQTFKAALRARYEQSDWLNVLKPINDEMRALQRDALVAYILHQMQADPSSAHIDTPEKLFEFFLMDVQMDPCMQTSRVRHALSSVQLFTERCFMNLETKVAPSIFEDKQRKQWEWMKRYRVWEANRKVFLWPENWIEPELRMDQSPIFKEAMSELLQSDITDDRAATALLNYLSKLEEVAKLEPCGIYFVEGDVGTSDDIAHVVARTAGGSRKYFYRRYEAGLWTPWEQIKLNIDDNPVIPVVWQNRLLLFWLKILQAPSEELPQSSQPPENSDGSEKTVQECTPSDLKKDAHETSKHLKVTVKASLCWSEYYNGKWQATKTSDLNFPTKLDSFAPGDPFNRSNLRLKSFKTTNASETVDALYIGIFYDEGGYSSLIEAASFFIMHNTHSLPVPKEEPASAKFLNFEFNSDKRRDISDLTVYYHTFEFNPNTFKSFIFTEDQQVLKNEISGSVINPLHELDEPWLAPFFYSDSRHVFYVTPEKAVVRVHHWEKFGKTLASASDRSAHSVVVPVFKTPVSRQADVSSVGIANVNSMIQFLSGDAYVNKGTPLTSTVSMNGTLIGPAGQVFKFTEEP